MNAKKLSFSEAYNCELAISHILSRYFKAGVSVEDTEYRSVNKIVLSSDEVKALSKLVEILGNKLYGED